MGLTMPDCTMPDCWSCNRTLTDAEQADRNARGCNHSAADPLTSEQITKLVDWQLSRGEPFPRTRSSAGSLSIGIQTHPYDWNGHTAPL